MFATASLLIAVKRRSSAADRRNGRSSAVGVAIPSMRCATHSCYAITRRSPAADWRNKAVFRCGGSHSLLALRTFMLCNRKAVSRFLERMSFDCVMCTRTHMHVHACHCVMCTHVVRLCPNVRVCLCRFKLTVAARPRSPQWIRRRAPGRPLLRRAHLFVVLGSPPRQRVHLPQIPVKATTAEIPGSPGTQNQ